MNLKEIGKVFTSKFVGTGPSSYKKRIYLAAVSQRLRNTALNDQDRTDEVTEGRNMVGQRKVEARVSELKL